MNFFNAPAVAALLDSPTKPSDEMVLSLAEKVFTKHARGDAMTTAITEMASMGEREPRWMSHSCERIIPDSALTLIRSQIVSVSLLIRFLAGVYRCRHEKIQLNPFQQNMVLSLAGRFAE